MPRQRINYILQLITLLSHANRSQDVIAYARLLDEWDESQLIQYSDHLDSFYCHLGWSCLVVGNYRNSIEHSKRYLKIAKENNEISGIYNAKFNILHGLNGLGDYNRILKKVASIPRDQLTPAQNYELCFILSRAYLGLGNYQEALSQIDSMQQCSGFISGELPIPDYVVSVDLSRALRLSRRPAEAAKQATKGLETARGAQQEVFPDLGHAYQEMGIVLYELGQLEDADKHFQQAITIHLKCLGEESPLLGTALYQHGLVLCALKQVDEGIKACEQGAIVLEKALGKDHPEVARSHHALGVVYKAAGKVEKAQEHLRMACEIALKHPCMGKDHPETRRFVQELGAVNVVQQLI
ncbi:MAG: tetratricopeptide repeat protein [Candidatus Obscuribacterales bacterium]